MARRTAAITAFAVRSLDSFRGWTWLLALGWVAVFLLLVVAPSLWLITAFLDTTLPQIYGSLGLALVLLANLIWKSPLELAPGLPGPITDMFPRMAVLNPQLNEFRRLGASVSYFVIVCGLWLAYLAATRAVERIGAGGSARLPSLKYILAGGLAFGALTLFWPGLFSTDVYLYAVQGKMQAVHGLNPLVEPPRLMGNDPLLILTPWRDIYSAYGPIWLVVARWMSLVAQAFGGSFVAYALVFKTLGVGLVAIGTCLVWAIGGELGWTHSRRAAATMLFAWCPLVIIELEANAHNDALLVVFVLAAVWLHLRGTLALAVGALVAGGLVKLTGFFLLPAYGIFLLRTSSNRAEAARRVILSAGVAVVVTVAAYAPYARPGVLRSAIANPMAGFSTNSLGVLVRQGAIDVALTLRGIITPINLTWRTALEAVRWPLWYGPLILWVVLALIFSLKSRDFTSLVRAWVLVMFSYLVLASVWFWPWYITWLIPLLVLLPQGRLRRAVLLLAFGGSIHYAMLPILPLDPFPYLRFYYVPAAIFLPTLIYCAWEVIRILKSRKSSSTEGNYDNIHRAYAPTKDEGRRTKAVLPKS